MPIARMLPSGSYRVRVFAGYEYVDGKKKTKYESFTADTKAEAEKLASTWNANKNKRASNITIHDAIDKYISAKTGVLSPSTIRGYRQLQNSCYASVNALRVNKLTTEDMQRFISGMASRVSVKTVKNAYGLLISAVRMFRPDAYFNVSMPKAVKKRKVSPTNAEVGALFSAASGDMKVCIALAAFGSMRRGEICALKYSDVNGNVVSVHADMVENEDNRYEYKEMPKTADSVREVHLPNEVIALIGTGEADDFIIKRTPNAVTHAFTRLRNSIGINIRFHDLRSYFAAIGAILAIPDNYLSSFGGWKAGSSVMKEVYQGIMPDKSGKYADKMNSHFSKVINGKVVPLKKSMTRNMTRNSESAV